MRRSEHLYRTIFENTGNANVLLREDTKIILVNSELKNYPATPKKRLKERKTGRNFLTKMI